MNDLGLVETVDRLGESIVITVADAAHRRLDRSSPIATDAHVRDPAPAAPRGNGPRARTCCLSACSWLHLLKSWSLRQTRSGSLVLDRARFLIVLGRFASRPRAHVAANIKCLAANNKTPTGGKATN